MRLFKPNQIKQSHPEISWHATDNGLRFEAPNQDSFEEFISRSAPTDFISRSQWLLLSELIDNGQAEADGNSVLVSYSELARLGFNECDLLGLPDYYPYDLQITADRDFSSTEFKLNYEFFQGTKPVLDVKRQGCILWFSSQTIYLLNQQQYNLVEAIDEFTNSPKAIESTQFNTHTTRNLHQFAQIKGLSLEAGALLDFYLAHEDVVIPKKIKLRLDDLGELIEIKPIITDENDDELDQFVTKFDSFTEGQEKYDFDTSDGGRKRVIFNHQQRKALDQIKNNRRVSRQELAIISETPQEFFDPEVIDLESDPESSEAQPSLTLSFSDRVRALGIFKQRVYPFILQEKNRWIPGIIIEESSENQVKIQDEEELEKLKRKIAQAEAEGKRCIKHNGVKIKLPVILPDIPKPDGKPDKESSSGPVVLLIDENTDELEYLRGNKQSKEEPFLHLLEPIPNLCNSISLYPHQKEGVAWLQQLFRHGYHGALLADDMGLGKTLQILSFLEWHHVQFRLNSDKISPYLIVAPITLLENWENEYQNFFPTSKQEIVTLYASGLKEYRLPPNQANHIDFPDLEGIERLKRIRQLRGGLNIDRLSKADIILTTYETIRDFQLDLGMISWQAIIIDEAQKIKTPGTLVTNAIKAMKSDFSLACTGTPVETSLIDLWCMFDFVAPGRLGSAKEFNDQFQKPLSLPSTDKQKVSRELRAKIGIPLKRRLKADHLKGLPSQEVQKLPTQMPEFQIDRYTDLLKQIYDNQEASNRNQILRVLHSLRLISDHPLLTNSNFYEIPVADLISKSAKLSATINVIQSIANQNEKVIVFTENRNVQHLLKWVIEKVFQINSLSIVNGDTPGSVKKPNSMQRSRRMKRSRQQTVDDFQKVKGFNAIIMSPLSAGFGLNITEANHVVHFSRWWNPAKEEQATGRVHRIGQEKTVFVYYPMSTHTEFQTFDVTLDLLIERRKKLAIQTLFPTETPEVTPLEVFDALGKEIDFRTEKKKKLTMKDIDLLKPPEFEGLIAAIFQKQNYQAELTPISGDKGADVVLLEIDNSTNGILLQVKQAREGRTIDPRAVEEVIGSRSHYREKYSGRNVSLGVVTNRKFSSSTRHQAKSAAVDLYDRKWLSKQLTNLDIYYSDIDRLSIARGDITLAGL